MATGDRFMSRGFSRIYWVTPYAAAPTLANIVAGTRLDGSIAEINGLTFRNEPIETPDMGTTFTTKVPGGDTAEDPVLTFYDVDDTNVNNLIRVALAKGNSGMLVVEPYGHVIGRRSEIWKVTSTGANDEWSAGNDPHRYVVTFAVTAAPNLNYTLPAS